MRTERLLQLVATSLVSNGVHRDAIKASVQSVLQSERDDTIARATQRATHQAERALERINAGVGTDIRLRSRDHQTLVDPNEFIDANNQVVRPKAGQAIALPDYQESPYQDDDYFPRYNGR